MNNWYIKNIKEDYISLSKELNLNTILTKVLVNRGYKDVNDINKKIRDPEELPGIKKVCHEMFESLRNGEHIRIIGDYDIDGICSTYIFEKTLKESIRHFTKKSTITSRIPNRLRDGYGLSTNLIEEARNDNVNTIITCDNGIKAFDAVDLANKYGIKVIITDHHEPDTTLPNAIAICNPKINDNTPFSDICGAVVAFKVCHYFRSKTFESDPCKYIEFAALATIGDIMPLIDENRYIVSLGLKYINSTANIGLRTLTEALGYGHSKPVDTKALGYFIGPCINAAGRLNDASIALKLFNAENQLEANFIVSELTSLNDERKKLTKYFTDVAKKYIHSHDNMDIMVVYCKSCPEGIIGNIAGKIKEEYGKPTIIVTDCDNGIKGSGRSVSELDLNQKCNDIKDIFTTFGGHKGAVGFTIETNDVDSTIDKLTELLNNNSEDEDNIYSEGVEIDMILPFKYIDMRLAREIEMLEPYGNKFPEPLFADKYVAFDKGVVLGKNRNLFKTKVTQDNISLDAIIIGDGDLLQSLLPYDLWDITFNITINRYNGRETLQLHIQHYKPS